MRKPSLVLSGIAITAMAAAAAVAGGPAQASSSGGTSGTHNHMTVLASHLSNPRDLTVAPDGRVFLAETGRANDKNCTPDAGCAGLTGSVDLVTSHGVNRIATGLISVGGPGGIGTEGAVSVSYDHGRLYVQFGLSTHEIPPSGPPSWVLKAAHRELGHLALVTGGPQGIRRLANVGDQDFQWTAEHKFLVPEQFPDSNPNDVLVVNGKRFVANAGANTLDWVDLHGTSHVIAFFPTPKGSPTDAVPTCVTKGPDGALYVGELLGGDFAPGHARVWRVAWKDGSWHKSVWARGFTTIQGCGFDRWGNFYATEFEVNGLNEGPSANPLGAVIKLSPSRHRTTIGMGQLFWPSGLAVGRAGQVYVSNCSISPGTGFGPCPNGGQVVRFS